MAIARAPMTQVVTKPMSSARIRLWPEGDEDHPEQPLSPGDLVVLRPLRPQQLAGPSGWTSEQGVFWKVLDEYDGPQVVLTAPYVELWEVEVYVLPAGTYSLPPSGQGSAVPWEPGHSQL